MSIELDHRQLADEMEIFVIDEQVGAGLPLWLPHGMAIRESLENYIKELERKNGYQRVASPHIAKGSLYERSGHLRKFKEDMFPPMRWPEDGSEYYLRPMNCPHHHQIYASRLRSYRQLPVKLAEYGQVYRFENSGSLKGLSRVRGLCQNDAHIYVDPSEAQREIESVLALHEQCYRALGLQGHRYRLSKHDPQELSESDGDKSQWLQAEEILRQALLKMKLPFFEAEGEAAFYGPKIDVQMKMRSGIEESIASVQLDFMSPERFDLSFVAPSGQHQRPWIVHRAPLGSHERFVALLLEYYQGRLPGWLAPVQLLILPVSSQEREAALQWGDELRRQGFRVQVDESEGSLSKRILFAHRLRPFAKMILGAKEIAHQNVQLQIRDEELAVSFDQVGEILRSRVEVPE